ncbi:MAG: ATP-binding cassette domain-containing protein [Bacillota bacterium]
MIKVQDLRKSFKVAKRKAGVAAAVASLFRREYEEIHALKGVSFTVTPGEIVGYIGPNGAGKSTTIKTMCGILTPDSGECVINGFVPWRERQRYVRNIGVVFGQRMQLWWDVPVIDSFELLREIYRVDCREFKNTLTLLIDSLNIASLLNTPLRQLSLGQRMRCELAASLLHSPDVLFLDEPTIGLDAVSKIAVRDFITMINRERQVTVVLTTHDMNDVEALTDRIILIGKGEILYDGGLTNLRSRYTLNKTMTLDYDTTQSVQPDVHGVSWLEWTAGRAVAEIDVRKTQVSKVIAQLSECLEIRDITVDSMPVEQIIVKLYEEHRI